MPDVDIHKVAGLIIQDRRVLASRSHGKDVFIQPGGKIEGTESPVECLQRELREEQGIEVDPVDLEFIGTYFAIAAGHEAEQLKLRADVYIVTKYTGELTPQAEIAENKWINSHDVGTLNLASIFHHDVIPELRRRDYID